MKSVASPTYNSWKSMMDRCYHSTCKSHRRYRGRGITVCKRWHSFENFLVDMGKRPIGRTLERVNNDGNYRPSNCRWATHAEQVRNTSVNRRITFRGETLILTDWARKTGINQRTLFNRIDTGWPIDLALTRPANHGWSLRHHALAASAKGEA